MLFCKYIAPYKIFTFIESRSRNLFKVNIGNTIAFCEFISKLTIKTPKRRHWHRSRVFFHDFQPLLHDFIVDFNQVNAGWVAF